MIPPDRLHLAHRFTQLLDYGDFVEARFENGASVSADALIGADGIHSAVRHALFGPEKPRFTGCVAHRGIVSASAAINRSSRIARVSSLRCLGVISIGDLVRWSIGERDRLIEELQRYLTGRYP